MSFIGAISSEKVLAVMTLDGLMDAAAFKVYVSECLIPRLWPRAKATVVMENLPAHKVEAIEPLMKAVGERVLCICRRTLQSLIPLSIGGPS